jgi:XTP/dITP diphosphohydrolase
VTAGPPDRPVQRVVLASGNAGKLREMRALLAGCGFEVLPQAGFGIEPPHEDGSSFVENALIKARHAARLSGLPAIADDSGLAVEALSGRPGIHSARFAGEDCSDEDNIDRLLAELSGVPAGSRAARYHCAMVFVRDAGDRAPIVREGCWEGSIGFERRGTGGFGYDPLFLVAGDTRTVAEMPADEKNRVSHRAQALGALVEALQQEWPVPASRP